MAMLEQELRNTRNGFQIEEPQADTHLSGSTSDSEKQVTPQSARECPAQQATGQQEKYCMQ
jgi:hypothetical protein